MFVPGAIREHFGNYKCAFYFTGSCMILSALVLALIPLWAKKQPQAPATSFLSIDPSQLEVIADKKSMAGDQPEQDLSIFDWFRDQLRKYRKGTHATHLISKHIQREDCCSLCRQMYFL